MTTQIAKADVLRAIDDEREAWNDLVAKIGQDRMEVPGFAGGGWTFKDLAAHLNGWELRTVARLEAAARGAPQPPNPWPAELDHVDVVNAWLYERYRDQPLDEILAEAAGLYDRLAAAIVALPDDMLDDPDVFQWTVGNPLGNFIVSGHYFQHLQEEHMPEINEWLEANDE